MKNQRSKALQRILFWLWLASNIALRKKTFFKHEISTTSCFWISGSPGDIYLVKLLPSQIPNRIGIPKSFSVVLPPPISPPYESPIIAYNLSFDPVSKWNKLTLWNSMIFVSFRIQILREINFEGPWIPKSAILPHLEALNFDLCEFLHFFKGCNLPK